jgi:hypothetical protein
MSFNLPDDYDVEIDRTDTKGKYAIRVVNRHTKTQLLFFTMGAAPLVSLYNKLHERLREDVLT